MSKFNLVCVHGLNRAIIALVLSAGAYWALIWAYVTFAEVVVP